jgi:hypothetical protein
MSKQFRNFDSSKREQRVYIEFEREILVDESPDLSYLEQDYVGVTPASERDKYIEQDKERLAAYNRRDWHMVGVRVVAHILVPIGGKSFRMFDIASAGLWGIESEMGEDYFAEVEAEEKSELISNIKKMGEAFANLDDEGNPLPSHDPDEPIIADDGRHVRHDAMGFYLLEPEECEHEDAGNNSVGFDGRPHYETIQLALDAVRMGDV